jgi:hypothetical protein
MFWHELWRQNRLAGLFGLILILIGESVRVTHPLVGETLWWIGLIAAMAGAIVDLGRKYANRANPSLVRIVAAPPGEAPLWVREQWVGLELPLAANTAKPQRYVTSGVLSGPLSFWQLILWQFIGRLKPASGYPVDVAAALSVLETKSPEAARWWHENVPDLRTRKRRFLFRAEVCRLEQERA